MLPGSPEGATVSGKRNATLMHNFGEASLGEGGQLWMWSIVCSVKDRLLAYVSPTGSLSIEAVFLMPMTVVSNVP